jgi:hypothetical protein
MAFNSKLSFINAKLFATLTPETQATAGNLEQNDLWLPIVRISQ